MMLPAVKETFSGTGVQAGVTWSPWMRSSMPLLNVAVKPEKATGTLDLGGNSAMMRNSVPEQPPLQSIPPVTMIGFVSVMLIVPIDGQLMIDGNPATVATGEVIDTGTWVSCATSALPFQSWTVAFETPHWVKSAKQSIPAPLVLGANKSEFV